MTDQELLLAQYEAGEAAGPHPLLHAHQIVHVLIGDRTKAAAAVGEVAGVVLTRLAGARDLHKKIVDALP